MFLNELNEKEASSFIRIVKELVMIDDVIAKEEKNLLQDYIEELNLVGREIQDISFEEAISMLVDSSEKVRRVIIFEITGLALIDGEFDDKEIKFVNDLAEKLNVTKNRVNAFCEYFKSMINVYKFTTVEYESKIKLLKEEAVELIK